MVLNPEQGSGPNGRECSPLPGVLADIARVAGRQAAIKIALAWGGEEIYLPRDIHRTAQGRALAGLVGTAAARAITALLGGDSVYVPFARKALAAYLAGEGRSVAEIASRLSISLRAARRYRAAR